MVGCHSEIEMSILQCAEGDANVSESGSIILKMRNRYPIKGRPTRRITWFVGFVPDTKFVIRCAEGLSTVSFRLRLSRVVVAEGL